MLIELSVVACVSVLIYIFAKVLKTYLTRMGYRTVVLFWAVLIAVSIIFYIRVNTPAGKGLFKPSSNVSLRYGIMFDAGSTGSRMHVFRFNVTKPDSSFILDDSLYTSTKPGLSSYAHSPKEAAQSLEQMLEQAKNYIPRDLWSATPIALRATAGLRLLPEKVADMILTEVGILFKSYPFKLVDNGVSILGGDDEGLFSWFTVNFLVGDIKNISETFGVLDLGGGSTQITLYPKVPSLSSTEHIVQVELMDKSHQMYTHSYLGLGMVSARFQILGGVERVSGEMKPQELQSPCLPTSYNGSWSYRGQNHTLRSTGESIERLQRCRMKCREVLLRYDVKKPSRSRFYAISYFFDVALEGGLIPDAKEGAEVQLSRLQELAATACMTVRAASPFRCIDLCYVVTLLADGYGFLPSQNLVMKKEIRNFEIAWPLGAMFRVFKKFNKVEKV